MKVLFTHRNNRKNASLKLTFSQNKLGTQFSRNRFANLIYGN